ncbi:DUF4350 domain-containing protein [Neobacillus kokaensis]|uniref:DUF4350 domain-containing protein n=1 Tax=Neobacillus kokaensis TaxID=2759023 RepID=A0ABQ3N383_9BACI|nr:DUF4350 domain-containing protein [Neobacillus kokaensis]GHH99069.1 hypothetical protein AM1BK_26120 [Neobacillus kokaensis]
MKKARQGWIWLAVLLVLFSVISYFAFSPKPRFFPSYVSDSPSPTGVKGFYTYLSKETKVQRWSYSPTLLPKGQEKQLMVMIEPLNVPETKEMKEYMDFIKAGNTILLLKDNPKGMLDINTWPVDEGMSDDQLLKVYDQNNNAYKANIKSYIRLESQKGNDILLKDKAGIVAMKRAVGKGQLIVAVTPEWVMNGNILKHDHLPLVLRLINESDAQTILIDEYLHGAESHKSAWMVYPKWFVLLILQGIILAILWLWLQGKRFGPIFLPREATVRFSDEGIRALAAWYIRGRRYHDSLVIQADFVKLLLQERWQIPYSRDWKDLASFLERKWQGIKPTEIRSFLQGLAAVLEKEKINKQEYLHWSGRLNRLQKEVEQG